MLNDLFAERYGRALFDVSHKANALDPVSEGLTHVAEALGLPEVVQCMDDPRTTFADRLALVDVATEGVHPFVANLARLMAQRRRVASFPGVQRVFGQLVDNLQGIARVSVTTAVPYGEANTSALEKRLSEVLGKSVRAQLNTDPEVLGGIVIRAGDRVIDASIRTRLERLRAALA